MLKLMSRGKQRSRTNQRETKRTRMVKIGLLGLAAVAVVSLAVIAVNRPAVVSTYVAPADAFSPAPTQTPMPTAVFIGDSYTAGTGSTSTDHAFPTLVAAAEGWHLENLGRGGTGYLATSGKLGCGLAYCPNYREMIAAAKKVDPTIVVVSGGRNDLGKAGVAKQVTGFYTDLRAAFPKATILATSPLWDDDPAPALIGSLGGEVKTAVKAVGGTYLDIGEPLLGHADDVISDGVHPNDGGHALIAAAISKARG